MTELNYCVPEMVTLKEASLRTGLSYDCLRKKCLNKEIAHIRSGKKFFVNYTMLCVYLSGGIENGIYKE